MACSHCKSPSSIFSLSARWLTKEKVPEHGLLALQKSFRYICHSCALPDNKKVHERGLRAPHKSFKYLCPVFTFDPHLRYAPPAPQATPLCPPPCETHPPPVRRTPTCQAQPPPVTQSISSQASLPGQSYTSNNARLNAHSGASTLCVLSMRTRALANLTQTSAQ